MNGKPVPVSPLEHHPDYTKTLGLISIEIGVLEIMLGEMLGAVLGINTDISQIIYMTPQSFAGRLQILENVSAAVLKPDVSGTKRIGEFIKRAKARIQYRNTTMHSVWGVLKSDTSVVTRRPIPFVDSSPQIPVPITELQGELQKLRELIDEVVTETSIIIESRAALADRLAKEREQGLPVRRIKGISEAVEITHNYLHPRRDHLWRYLNFFL
jgi:hypothetical protein